MRWALENSLVETGTVWIGVCWEVEQSLCPEVGEMQQEDEEVCRYPRFVGARTRGWDFTNYGTG